MVYELRLRHQSHGVDGEQATPLLMRDSTTVANFLRPFICPRLI